MRRVSTFALWILACAPVLAQAPKVTILEQNTLVMKEKGRIPLSSAKNEDGSQDMEPDRYIAWGTAAHVQDELWLAYSGDRDAHVCPWGVTRLIKSRDGGKTWSGPETINNTPLDDRDCGLLVTSKGTVIITWFTSLAFDDPGYSHYNIARYRRHAEKLTPEVRKQWLGNWIVRSEDGGKTWGEPIRVATTSPHGGIVLKNTDLMNVGMAYIDGKKCVGVEVSQDDGKTWRILSTIPIEGYKASEINEPHVAENSDGSLVALLRWEPQGRDAVMLQSESRDGGRTWTQAHETTLKGLPPHILKMRDGTLVLTYGYRWQPYGERASISRDGGKTWSEPIQLAPALNGDLGYPSSVEMADGSILTFYYQQEKQGEPTCMFSTHWRLEE